MEEIQLMKPLVLGDMTSRLPVIQGGMGVGVSLSGLAGAVANAGGIGIISTAQIGFDDEEFLKNPKESNLRAIKRHIGIAKEQKKDGLVGVNVMVALKDYREHVRAAVEAGADVVISGAGLPVDLPELVAGSNTKIAPIVSSAKAANVILSMWDRKYKKTADFVVIEGPKAGGHLGFNEKELEDIEALDYDMQIKAIIDCVKTFAKKYNYHIPVIVAGGIFDREDVKHVIGLGADGVQVATRFVVTEECDASEAYKQAYIDAKAEDVRIIKSPVGMPGRALNNVFIKKVSQEKEKITSCLGCLAHCNPAQVPYCITKALINAVKGDVDNGLVFCGANVDRIKEMTTVEKLMKELTV